MTVKTILFLAFPAVGEQDLLAPWELLRGLSYDLARDGEDELEITLGNFEGGVVTTHMGAQLQLDRAISADDRFDLLYIPGGIGGGQATQDPRVLDLIRAHHAEGRWVAANCSGVGVVHRSGILEGLQFHAPAVLARRIREEGGTVADPRRLWSVLPEEKIFTSGGAATVHPSTIALVSHLFGEQRARAMATTWDSYAVHGGGLFGLTGPLANDDPAAREALQDGMEKVFLPDVAGAA
jgi:putative intracellular protease/amidase